MNPIGNIVWFVFGGWLLFLLYFAGSILLCITIIGIPFGIQTFKLAFLSLAPFGSSVVPGARSSGCLYLIMNIIWIFTVGIEIAVLHIVLGVLFGITIIGIPLARQHFKLAFLGFIPFGNDIVPGRV